MDYGKITTYILDTDNGSLADKLRNVKEKLEGLGLKQATLDSYYSKYIRSPIAKKYGYNSKEHLLSKEITKISLEEKNKILKKAAIKVATNNRNQIPISKETVLEVIRNNINSGSPIKKTVALLLASGSRPIEFLDKSNYKVINEHYVEQDYVAKKRQSREKIIKPIIGITAEQFVNGHNDVIKELKREYGHVYKNDRLNTSLVGHLAKATNEIIGQTTYALRHYYANTSYDIYGKNTSNTSISAWMSDVLGHQPENLTTSLNYQKYKIIDYHGY